MHSETHDGACNDSNIAMNDKVKAHDVDSLDTYNFACTLATLTVRETQHGFSSKAFLEFSL